MIWALTSRDWRQAGSYIRNSEAKAVSLYLEYESSVPGSRDNREYETSLWCSSNTLASRG